MVEKEVAELRIIVSSHDKEIRELKESHKELREVLVTIKETFIKIKYWLIGGISFFVAAQLGVVETLRILLGI